MKIRENENRKEFSSPGYNYVFNKQTGFFARWGKNRDDDPDYSPFGPEILDIEISSGKCSGNCAFCYKENGANVPEKHMTLDAFKLIAKSFPKTLTQIAFGITDINANPSFFPIMKHAKDLGIAPNYTTNGNGVIKEVAQITAELCGAVAVSLYDVDTCYNAIEKFCEAGMEQVNIHYMLSEETIENAFVTLHDIKSDPRLKDLNAIVFLQYKPHGRGQNNFTPIHNLVRFEELIMMAKNLGVGIGFDSCTAPIYLKTIQDWKDYENLSKFAEPCESGLFSLYINVDGEYFPCSFMEGEKGWEKGLRDWKAWKFDFIQDIWYHRDLIKWRMNLIRSSLGCKCKSSPICRSCPTFPITSCKVPYYKHDDYSITLGLVE